VICETIIAITNDKELPIDYYCERDSPWRGKVYEKSHLFSIDEKSGIQALNRKESPMEVGKDKRQEFEYERNGTTTLIAAQNVKTGEMAETHLGPTRTEEDFLNFCKKITGAVSKEDEIIFLADQLNTHKSASLVKWIAKEIGFKGYLGEKGKSGILKSMESRRIFLETPMHRIRFLYTPKHCSWLNPIENWFSKLQRHVITGGVFPSLDDLKNKIKNYIEYYNKCMLKPMKWKFKGFSKSKILVDSIVLTT